MQRFAIVGTAPSWQQTPWNDPGLHIASLNDAYRMKGFVRADRWYDTHPLDHFYVVPETQTKIFAHQVPPGHYVRPKGHVEWLGSQSIPVYLNPDYLTQHPAAASWRHAHPIPWEAISGHFGRYFTSSPALMMAHAMLEGYRDISAYGIHLASEAEYVDQRPQFEFIIGRLLGSGKQTMTVKDGMRHYETPDAHVALPAASPVLQSDHIYSFETKPRAYLEPLKWDYHRFGVKKQRALVGLIDGHWWQKRRFRRELAQWDAYQQDTQEQMQRLELSRRME